MFFRAEDFTVGLLATLCHVSRTLTLRVGISIHLWRMVVRFLSSSLLVFVAHFGDYSFSKFSFSSSTR